MIFLDTSFIVSYYNERDDNHLNACEIMEKIKEGAYGGVCFNDYIFDECATVLFVRLKALDKTIEICNGLRGVKRFCVDDSVFEKTYRISVDDDVDSGIYPITITAYYDNKESDEETIDLTIDDCVMSRTVTPVQTQPVDVVTTEATSVPLVTKQEKEPIMINFRETSEYLTLLAILFVILLGGVIYAIGAMIILAKRR